MQAEQLRQLKNLIERRKVPILGYDAKKLQNKDIAMSRG